MTSLAAIRPRTRPDKALSADEWIAQRLNGVMLAIGQSREDEVRALVDEIIDWAPAATAAIEMAAEFAAGHENWADLVRYRAALAAARPADRRAKAALIWALIRAKATSAALDLVGRGLEREGAGAGFRRLRLEALLAAGDRPAAAALCRELAEAPVGDGAAFAIDVALILARGEAYDMARDWIARAQSLHGDEPDLARLAAALGDGGAGWEAFERARGGSAFAPEVDQRPDDELSLGEWVARRFNQVMLAIRDGAKQDVEALVEEIVARAPEATAPLELAAQFAASDGDWAGLVRYRSALTAAGAGRAADATAHYRQAFEEDGANEGAARHLVRQAIAEGRLEEAPPLIARLERGVGRSVVVIGLKARLAMARGDSEAAVAEYRQGLADRPMDVNLRRELADFHGGLGDYEAMGAVLRDAEKLAPRDPLILSRLLTAGTTLQTPPDQLLVMADRVLAVRPADQGVLRQKANLLIRMGERRDAVAVLIAAIDISPANVSAWTGAISNLMILNEPARAAELVDRARARFSADTASDLVAMAEILESADRGDEAVDYAERAVAKGPASAATRIIAARLWESRGLYRRAWPHLLALQDIDVEPARGALTFARVARALHYVDARPVADAESDRFPDAIFDRIGRSASRRRFDEAAPLALHVTSSLAAGGSERQVALTVRGLAATPGALAPHLVVQDINPLTGRDFFLPTVQAYDVPVSILAKMRGEGMVRELAAMFPDRRPEIGLLSALPTEVANVALPLYSLIHERRPRVVHLWQDAIVVAGGVAAMLAGVPHIVLSTRSTRPIERQRARPYLKAGYHALLRYPGTTMLNNSLNGARDYADWLGIEPERIHTLHNGFVFEDLEARADAKLTAVIRGQLGAGREDVVIGGVMRCSFEKRPDLWADTLIELAKNDPRIRGLLVGEGPMRAELQARLDGLGLGDRIQFVGRQAPIEPWMNAMDILFLSSVTEGLPNVLIEAQALGVAVATLRVGGAPETVRENETALVIDDGPLAEIAGAIAPLTLDADLRKRFGAAGVKWARTAFSLDAAIARLGEIYAEG